MVINPFTFLPVTDDVVRRAPQGHARLGDGMFSGWFDVTLTARTPLLLGPLEASGQGNGGHVENVVATPPKTPDGLTVMIPGSSLAGAVRSIHEAMNNSCFRVFDEGYRAVHRHAVEPSLLQDINAGTLRMAAVAAVSAAGLPTHVLLCDKVVWVRSDKFTFPPRTGDRVKLPDEPRTEQPHQRPARLHTESPAVARTDRGRWTVLVTDIAARHPDHPVYFACGRLELRTVAEKVVTVRVPVPTLTQAALARAIETSRDLSAAPVAPGAPAPFVEVVKNGVVIGERLALAHDGSSMTPMPIGAPVWVRLDTGPHGREVSEIRLSLAWRRTSDIIAQQRVPDTLLPCQDPNDLCPSCLVFGSAGADDQDPDAPTEQNSYRGHVRFADALASKAPSIQSLFRAPLASPKPTAGQFYLDNTRVEGRVNPNTPLAQWDSKGDRALDGSVQPRSVRGRKFYWRTSDRAAFPPAQHRGRKREHHSPELTQRITLLGAGSAFTARITFDNLTPAQVGSLLAAVDPSLALKGEQVISVGGGKPFGWGAVQAAIGSFMAQDATARYAGTPAPTVTSLQDCVTAYLHAMEGQPARAQWETLGKLLTVNPPGVQDAHVWYPPNPKPGKVRGSKAFDEGFEFWQKSNGFQLHTPPHRPLRSLPDASATDQNIPEVQL